MSTNENEILESQIEVGELQDEDEDEDVAANRDEQGRVKIEVSSGNAKTHFFTTVPDSMEEAASDEFYGSEEAALKALRRDWTTRKKNSVRPGLQDAQKQGINLEQYAQNTADAYRPGRRGGFQVVVGEDEIRSAGSVDDVLALLKARGVQFT